MTNDLTIIIATVSKRNLLVEDLLKMLSKSFNVLIVGNDDAAFFSSEEYPNARYVQLKGSLVQKWLACESLINTDYTLLLDDDILIESIDTVKSLLSIAKQNKEYNALAPFLIDKYVDHSLSSRFMVWFHTKFKIWDVDDYAWKVYSIYGKGWATFKHKLPKSNVTNCDWLTNACLFIKSSVFIEKLQYLNTQLKGNYGYWSDLSSIWSNDLMLIYGIKGLTFIPSLQVIHGGSNGTSHGFYKRIIQETMWGYWYYMHYFNKRGLYSGFVQPNIVRFVDYVLRTVTGERSLIELPKIIFYLFYSYLFLVTKITFEQRGYYVRFSRTTA